MGIPIEKHFIVDAARADVWAFLTDPARVAGCLPGAAITEQVDERTYTGTISIKVGPVSARYKGKVRFERLDEEEGVAEIAASGQDLRGKGGADLRMTSRIDERGPSETEVTVESTVNVTGILAQFGRGMIQDLSDQMFRQFTDAMRAALESPPEPAADAPAKSGADRPAGDRPATTPQAEGAAGAGGTLRRTADLSDGVAAAADAAGGDEIDAVLLGATIGRRALARAVRRPGFWILTIVIVASILWLLVN